MIFGSIIPKELLKRHCPVVVVALTSVKRAAFMGSFLFLALIFISARGNSAMSPSHVGKTLPTGYTSLAYVGWLLLLV